MKEMILTQVEGGYIVRLVKKEEQVIKVVTNFGGATKLAREFFGEQIERSNTGVIAAV